MNAQPSDPFFTGGSLLSASASQRLQRELSHMRSGWWWFLLLGILLATCGTAAIVIPKLTVATTFVTVIVLGIMLMIGGVAMIVNSFWAGRWSGFLLHLLVGVLYVVAGFIMADKEVVKSAFFLTMFIAAAFIVVGAFRIVAALAMQFPQWGWVLLNGIITLLAGLIIYRHSPESELWVIGLLVGLEMLFNGWSWIMLALAIRSLPEEKA